jgi:hypothetical protein
MLPLLGMLVALVVIVPIIFVVMRGFQEPRQ